VHLLFLDESGQLSERRFFALGGVALRDHEWHHVRDLWQETLAEHAWPLGREIKWHGIRTGEVPPTLADAVVGVPLLPRFAFHPATGELDGVGLKRFPETVRRPRREMRLF
jgi:hypothetical protein